MSDEAIGVLVAECLENAYVGGYDLRYKDPDWVVDDLLQYAAPLEGCEPSAVRPHVVAWQERRRS